MFQTLRLSSIITFLFIPCLLAWSACLYADLEYKNRGDRFEGKRSVPVSGAYIELISATVDEPTGTEGLPEHLRVKFFLPHTIPVFITVRELKNKHYYWLDKVKPRKRWRPGFDNQFSWSSTEVLQHLDAMKLAKLGALVRLEEENRSMKERVAPAVFYSSVSPTHVKAYRFVFILGRVASLRCRIIKIDTPDEPLFHEYRRKALAIKPMFLDWDSSEATEGWYRLTIDGRVKGTIEEWIYSVEFYHQPTLEP